MESELARRGIKVVNALTVLRRTASEDWKTGNLSFFREDHHWNPRGVEQVATAVSAALLKDGWRDTSDYGQPTSSAYASR
jgi:hypothetical protein